MIMWTQHALVCGLLIVATLGCVHGSIAFSFCLITGTNTTGIQTASSFMTLTTGIINTTATAYNVSAVYNVTAFTNAVYFATLFPTPVSAILTAPGGYGGNDNLFTLGANGSIVTTDSHGITFSTGSNAVNFFGGNRVGCFNAVCGTYGIATVQLYTGGSIIPCSAPGSTSVVSAVGDPMFYGIRGQKYQIHGIHGAVYNLISHAGQLQLNALFYYLNGPRPCPIMPSTGKKSSSCWSHNGSYLREIGVQTGAGERLLIKSGSAEAGFESVLLDGHALLVGDNIPLVHLINTHELMITVGVWTIECENIDGFLNLRQIRIHADLSKLTSHGLIGQTWNPRTYKSPMKVIEGDVDDYLVSEGSVFGNLFQYNQFMID